MSLHAVDGAGTPAFERAEAYSVAAAVALGFALGFLAQAAGAAREVRADELRARRAAARAENVAHDAAEELARLRPQTPLEDEETFDEPTGQ